MRNADVQRAVERRRRHAQKFGDRAGRAERRIKRNQGRKGSRGGIVLKTQIQLVQRDAQGRRPALFFHSPERVEGGLLAVDAKIGPSTPREKRKWSVCGCFFFRFCIFRGLGCGIRVMFIRAVAEKALTPEFREPRQLCRHVRNVGVGECQLDLRLFQQRLVDAEPVA